ncbi:hypothetical protein CALCODRAFT_552512 [Calocera cornea HHB12733]|uniref:Uncharacterized protein n=1 Tax=Calocera cornea HHB12733 TaxID=1353952 RepID=A0A165K627_9BASI|nr:hypothetical protein CALCODRAFT_552512 [Calocera cornea HHB12733]
MAVVDATVPAEAVLDVVNAAVPAGVVLAIVDAPVPAEAVFAVVDAALARRWWEGDPGWDKGQDVHWKTWHEVDAPVAASVPTIRACISLVGGNALASRISRRSVSMHTLPCDSLTDGGHAIAYRKRSLGYRGHYKVCLLDEGRLPVGPASRSVGTRLVYPAVSDVENASYYISHITEKREGTIPCRRCKKARRQIGQVRFLVLKPCHEALDRLLDRLSRTLYGLTFKTCKSLPYLGICFRKQRLYRVFGWHIVVGSASVAGEDPDRGPGLKFSFRKMTSDEGTLPQRWTSNALGKDGLYDTKTPIMHLHNVSVGTLYQRGSGVDLRQRSGTNPGKAVMIRTRSLKQQLSSNRPLGRRRGTEKSKWGSSSTGVGVVVPVSRGPSTSLERSVEFVTVDGKSGWGWYQEVKWTSDPLLALQAGHPVKAESISSRLGAFENEKLEVGRNNTDTAGYYGELRDDAGESGTLGGATGHTGALQGSQGLRREERDSAGEVGGKRLDRRGISGEMRVFPGSSGSSRGKCPFTG